MEKEIEQEMKEEQINENVTSEIDLNEKISSLEKEVNDWKSAYAIKLADFQNYTKRKDKEFEDFKKYACENLIIKLLETVDTLTLAKQSADSANDFNALSSGIEMIINNMKTVLEEEGVEEIKTENEKYDPYVHYAVATDIIEDKEDNIITDVLQKGYKLKGKVIRPSMVKINKK